MTILFWVQIGSLVLLFIYASVTMLIWHTMNKANDLTTKQLIGTQAAVVDFYTNNRQMIPAPNPIGNSFNLTLQFKNDGHVIANSVHIRAYLQMLRVSDGQYLGERWSCSHTIPTMIPNAPQLEFKQCFVKGILDSDLYAIKQMTETVALDGEYTYDNGFSQTISVPVCFRYFPIHEIYGHGESVFYECDVFPQAWEALLGDKKKQG